MLVHLLKFPPEKEGLEYERLKIKGSPWGRRNGRWKGSRAEGRGRKMMEKLWGEGPGGVCGSCPRREELQEDKWLHSQGWERWKIRHTALDRRGKQRWGAGQASPTLTTPRGKLWGPLSHLEPSCAAPRCHKPRTALARNLLCLLWNFRSILLIVINLGGVTLFPNVEPQSHILFTEERIKSFSSFYY